jgi:hypothetical protein
MSFFERWGPIGLADRVVSGDPNSAKDLNRFGREGRARLASGTGLSDEALANARRLAAGYEQMLRSGKSVLPDSTASVLKRARGQITDTNTRDIMASTSRLRQARLASGGKLSAEAAQEYQTEAEAEANRAQQEAGVSLSGQEAQLELAETNTLRDRLQQAFQMLQQEGQFRQQLGQAGQAASLGLRLDRHKAIAQTIASIFGASFTGGAGAGAGGGGFS